MNVRIKLLRREASLCFDVDTPEKIEGYRRAWEDKFAELIIRECADVVNSGIDPEEGYLIGDDILKWFGIKK